MSNNYNQISSFIWNVCDDVLRGLFKQHEYGDVILPFTVLRRLDCVLEVIKWIKEHYGKSVPIRVDTNGQGYLYNRDRDVIKELEDAGVNKISVSLNAHNKETYNQVCKPRFMNAFESIKEFIEKAKEKFEVEVTAVTIPEVNLLKVEKLAHELGVKFRKRQYIPGIW